MVLLRTRQFVVGQFIARRLPEGLFIFYNWQIVAMYVRFLQEILPTRH